MNRSLSEDRRRKAKAVAKPKTRGDVIYLNPGSAGPRRFQLPVTVARLAIAGSEIKPEIVHLNAVRQMRKSPR